MARVTTSIHSARSEALPAAWRRIKVWTAYDVIKQAGYPVERHRGIRTNDDYRMEMVRIFRKGDFPTPSSPAGYVPGSAW